MVDNEPRITEVPTGLVVGVGRVDKRVVREASAFVTSHAAGEFGMGPYTGGRRAPTHDEIAHAFCSTVSRALENSGLIQGVCLLSASIHGRPRRSTDSRVVSLKSISLHIILGSKLANHIALADSRFPPEKYGLSKLIHRF